MSKRLAAAASLIVFLVCLVSGTRVGNSFGTTVGRAMLAMAVTLVIGLIVGGMIEAALTEKSAAAGANREKSGTDSGAGDR